MGALRDRGGLGCGRGGQGEGKGREGEVEGREREDPKLLLNQGPSEPCYATAAHVATVFVFIVRLRCPVVHWLGCTT